MTEPHPPFPEPLDDDDDDVAWALQTAKVQWTRGGHADAIVWLGRAADTADGLGNVWRASDLRRMADDLAAYLARPSRRPPMPLPRFESGDLLVDELLSARDDSAVVTSVPPRSVPPRSVPPRSVPPRSVPPRSVPPRSVPPEPLPSYAPVDDAEFEDDIVLEDDVDDDAPNLEIAELRDSAVELRDSDLELRDSDVELRDSAVELRDSEVELSDDHDAIDDDVIADDALDVPAVNPARQSPVPARHPYDSEELPTQPHIDSPRFPLSMLGPPLPSAPAPEEDPHVADVLLGEVHGLEDVPPEGQEILAREARIERLGADEEISSFGLALVVRGGVKVMPAIADLACAHAAKGEIVWSEGNLEDGVALRLVAGEDATEVAVWDAELLKGIVRDYPWVVEDLRALADRFQALAGVAMGPMGERLDDSLRAMVTERCEIKRLLPGELLTNKGKAVGGMYIMAAGRLEILNGDQVESELGPGDFLFGAQVLSNGKAPNDTRAGKGGALVLFASRSIAHELLLSVPPLLEIFAS
jgi:CRP-like cAMP-binding protein